MVEAVSSPFRFSGKEATTAKTLKRKKTDLSAFTYIAMCSASIALAGVSGEYLNKGMPSNHCTFTAMGVILALLMFAGYFGFRGWSKTVRSPRTSKRR